MLECIKKRVERKEKVIKNKMQDARKRGIDVNVIANSTEITNIKNVDNELQHACATKVVNNESEKKSHK